MLKINQGLEKELEGVECLGVGEKENCQETKT